MSKQSLLISAVLAALCIVAVAYFMSDDQNKTQSGNISDTVQPEQSETLSKTKLNGEQNVADAWQWQRNNETTDQDSSNSLSSALFTEQSVHDALQAVRLDENGDVILDYDAQIALDEALERIYQQLDPASLLALQDMIKEALPGKAGEQISQLVEDYQGFLQARDQLSQMHENVAGASSLETVAAVDQDVALYAELQSLRELHLGTQTADSLFAVADANSEFMFESMRLTFDQSLSPEERAARQEEVQQQFQEQMDAHLPNQQEDEDS